MAETYCGKTCADCVHRKDLNCPSCKTGPGNRIGGSCDLARCCRTKGHETCDTCGFHSNCGTFQGRESVPDLRLRKLAQVEEERAAVAKRAPILGKWLWILFWLIVPAEIAGLMTNESLNQLFPALYLPGSILQIICSLLYGLILLKLAPEEEFYRRAGVCALITAGVSILTTVLFGSEVPTWSLLITLPAAVVSFIGEYYEYTAHGNVLWGIDNELSDKWTRLWKWYIISFAAMFGSILVLVIIPVLGLIIMAVSAIAVLVVGILKLYYLYCTAKVFRTFDPAK